MKNSDAFSEPPFDVSQTQELALTWAKALLSRGFGNSKILEKLDPDLVVGSYLWLASQAEDGPLN